MPPARWEPPAEIQKYLLYKLNGTYVHCKVCHGEASGTKTWIKRESLKAHLRSPTHDLCHSMFIEREQRRNRELEDLEEAYGAEGISEYPLLTLEDPSHLPSMFQDSSTEGDTFMDAPRASSAQLMQELGLDFPSEVPRPEEARVLLQQEYERMLQDAYQEAHFGEDVGDQFVGDDLPKGSMDYDEEEDECFDLTLREDAQYHPYPNKTVMLLDVMDNLPRCRFTSGQLSLIIHFAKQLGAPDVPSLKTFRKMQQKLQLECGNEPVQTTSQLGNIFFMNDIRETLARDMANPLVAPHMQFYPEEPAGPISETYQAERWMEYTPDQLTPMFSKGLKRFWLNELSRLQDGRYVIPHTWIIRNHVLTSDVTIVTHMQDGCWKLSEDNFQTINAVELDLDFKDITAEFGENLVWVDESAVPKMPNPMRDLVDDDEDLFVVMASPWADDVSGNKSKQYNKHMNMYTGNGCLPGRLLQQEFHVHYVSTSPHASSAEQFSTFRDHVNSTETNPVKCYNASTKRKCRFIIRAPGLPADNPQQSEEASHIGGNSNSGCRKCHWGGTRIEKESVQTYHECHFAGAARSAEEIRANLEEQFRKSMRGDADGVQDHQRSTGTKDKIAQHWIETLIAKCKAMKAENPRRKTDDIAAELQTWFDAQPGDKMNPLLDIAGLDPSQDTPVELLHTILLGVIKYIWHILNTSQWSDTDRHLLAIRLQSTDLTGLTIPPLRAGYMIQYKNNLIGKHFKSLMQILAFHVHGISTPAQFTLIKAAGDLGARLWVPEIDNMDEYLDDLSVAIANVLDAFDEVDPCRILVKVKLHLLAHIPDDARRFGPLIRVATEIYEAFNGVFRLCSIYSNHRAPSRDISRKFASMSRVKHLLSGGYWLDTTSKRWIQAGTSVRQVLEADKVLQRHLGWVASETFQPGQIVPSAKKNMPIKWSQAQASRYWSTGSPPLAESQWRIGKSLVAQSGDKIVVGSWAVALDAHGRTIMGRVVELLVGEKSIATLEQFICSTEAHPDFGWPILRRPNGTEIITGQGNSFLVLDSSQLQFVISVQHDCRQGACKPGITRKELQERQETDRDVHLLLHSDDDHFILNMAALHNFVRLRRTLPRSMTTLNPLHKDRVQFHKEAATKAANLRAKGRKTVADKRRATAAAKKEEAELAAKAAKAAEDELRRAEEAEAEGVDLEDPESDIEPSAEGPQDDDFEPGDGSDTEYIPRADNPRKRRRRR